MEACGFGDNIGPWQPVAVGREERGHGLLTKYSEAAGMRTLGPLSIRALNNFL